MTNFIYAYTHSGNAIPWKRPSGQSGNYWIKVGQTTHEGIERVRQQVGTAFPGLVGVDILLHSEIATRPDGSTFTDHDVHKLLTSVGVVKSGGEWFETTLAEVRAAILSLQHGVPFNPERIQDFPMRDEQRAAVAQTATYFRQHDGEKPKFLWNAKMRFGKTFTTYQLAKEMGWKRLLVLTYKPAVRSAWRDDLLNHIDFANWRFIDSSTPMNEADSVVNDEEQNVVWFASFQDAAGRDFDGKPKLRNETLHIVDWDCIVIDEFHFGAATAAARELYDPQDKADAALARQVELALDQENDKAADVLDPPDYGLSTRFHLHLSGTPFKAITNGDYAEDAVFNWTYIDEQRAKQNWDSARGANQYASLPQMQMFTYSMGGLADEWAIDGEFDGFNLNTYFAAKYVDKRYRFDRPDNIASFLDLIRGKKKLATSIIEGGQAARFPYESAALKDAVRHSVWYLNDVAGCEAMADLLRTDPFFSQYEIYVAAGSKAKIGAEALPPLQKALQRAEKTGKSGSITLSCGKLMTGVTVPEWTSIFMLRSLRAPESYFQAAFRVQSPWSVGGEILKPTAYVFEFDPNRALSLVALYGTEIANNSADRDTTQRDVLGELINFLPIFAIDGGHMEALDVDAILDWAHSGISANSLARKWKSADLYDLNGITMGRLLEEEDLLAELEQIEDFRAIREEAKRVVTNSDKLREIKRKGGSTPEQKKPRSDLAKQRASIRDKLKKISAKVLIFMYLTDFREERLTHVIESLDTDLFLRSTGLSLRGFRRLAEIGVFNISQMNDAIQKFRYFERKSIEGLVAAEPEYAVAAEQSGSSGVQARVTEA